MARLNRQQWLSLIAEFESSGLSQAEFCKQRELNPKYFSLKRSKLNNQDSTGVPTFSQVILASPRPSSSSIELEFGRVTLKVNQSTPADYLAQVIRALA